MWRSWETSCDIELQIELRSGWQQVAVPALVAVLLAGSCVKEPSGPTFVPEWMALTARVDGHGQIYLVDINDPTHYKQVTDNNHQNAIPTFSPDHTRLIFLDLTSGFVHNPQMVLYAITDDRIQPLELPNSGHPFPVAGNPPVVFSRDGAGFYFRVAGSWSGSEIVYYGFSENTMSALTFTPGPSEFVIGFKGADTLIIFSNDTATTHQPMGFYLMDLEANYLSFIDNPHLELINVDGVNKKAAYNPKWNDELGLFVFAHLDSTIPGYRIAITNLDGSFYQAYTSGNYIDDFPTWGPGGQTVFFHRRRVTDYDGPYRVLVLDVRTGAVRELMAPESIDDATSLMYPAY